MPLRSMVSVEAASLLTGKKHNGEKGPTVYLHAAKGNNGQALLTTFLKWHLWHLLGATGAICVTGAKGGQ